MKLTVHYGESEITFELVRKNVKHINVTVQPDQSIFVSANTNVSVEEVKSFVQSKGRWIASKLHYFTRHMPYEKLPREYVTGETFRYLGRQYRLKVFTSDVEYVRFFRGTIEMYVKDVNDFCKKKQLLDQWYDDRRTHVFKDSLHRMYKNVHMHRIPLPQLKSRHMRVRWGSYLPNQHTIILNKDLIIAPRFCIDYVVLHELLHARFPDHDFHFFNQLHILMPDWQQRKRILDEEIAREL